MNTGTRIPAEAEIEGLLKKLNKPSVKTIQSEDGDVVDCVDIYKQPAFDHPLLKNHTIMVRFLSCLMRPSFLPKVKKDNFSLEATGQQIWQRRGSCPSGTIPIQRIRKRDLLKAGSFGHGGLSTYEPQNCTVQTAGATESELQPYYGVKAYISVWDLLVVSGEWSLNSVAAVNHGSLVEAGWGNLSTFPLMRKAHLGLQFNAFQDDIQQSWWFLLSDEIVGYWPMSIVPNLPSAKQVEWLGKVCDTETRGYHTTTQMGNGHFPSEGHLKSSFFRDMFMKTKHADFDYPLHLEYTKIRHCYDVEQDEYAVHLYYGGPGGPCCDGRCS
ncbi:uncharacterized protein LOC103702215 [Phoenix dactylifera]|uniref:Uncharacterized protein LOC103702215 n=1 Tax=Phoenix dactylifera TaxID=42345 RepID=A0A8B9A377_PHODC|nr:uncharacterized protein LOC103702215 [Phoenix dactylifera]